MDHYHLLPGDNGKRILDLDNSIYCLTFVCMIDSMRLDWGFTKYLEDYFFKASMIYFIQMVLISFMLRAALMGYDGLDYVKPTFNQLSIRLLCCYLFHFSNYREVSDSWKRLKFLRRFPERFGTYVISAFFTTIYQFTSGIGVEIVNIVYLCRQKNLVSVMICYIAFAGIS